MVHKCLENVFWYSHGKSAKMNAVERFFVKKDHGQVASSWKHLGDSGIQT